MQKKTKKTIIQQHTKLKRKKKRGNSHLEK